MSRLSVEKTMSCEGCPELHSDGAHYIVYAGGPEHAPFAAMRALPKPTVDIIRRFSYPTIHKDGRIEYPEDGPTPPIPEGYQALTPWVLKPIWVFCSFRLYQVRLHDEGYLEIIGKCANPASGIRGNESPTNAFCQTCPKRNACA
jgi:hypothetical protein